MEHLEEKYKKDKLTVDELKKLRERVNQMSDDQLEEHLFESWKRDMLQEVSVPDERLSGIKKEIDHTLFSRPALVRFWRWGRIAAAILLPVFILTTLYFYHETRSLESGNILFSTLTGEHASVTLPDGTKVTMNANSSLTYSAKEFNRKERSVNFNGEAYFDVTKNREVPFIVLTEDLKVKVLGTKFNLRAYAGRETMELTLEEGEVLLSSRIEEKKLFPHQKAVLNCTDGRILILQEELPENASVWRNNELVFVDEPLEHVVQVLEENYGIDIHLENSKMKSDLFTGRVPANDLLNALEILRYSYHMDYRVDAKDIYFRDK